MKFTPSPAGTSLSEGEARQADVCTKCYSARLLLNESPFDLSAKASVQAKERKLLPNTPILFPKPLLAILAILIATFAVNLFNRKVRKDKR